LIKGVKLKPSAAGRSIEYDSRRQFALPAARDVADRWAADRREIELTMTDRGEIVRERLTNGRGVAAAEESPKRKGVLHCHPATLCNAVVLPRRQWPSATRKNASNAGTAGNYQQSRRIAWPAFPIAMASQLPG
jgi:hypothetical protein